MHFGRPIDWHKNQSAISYRSRDSYRKFTFLKKIILNTHISLIDKAMALKF